MVATFVRSPACLLVHRALWLSCWLTLSSALACSDSGGSGSPRRTTDEREDDDSTALEDDDERLDASVRRDSSAPSQRADASVPEPAEDTTSDSGTPDAVDSSTSDSDANVSTPPAKNYDWSPGDYPPNLHAQEYLELKGLPGQGDRTRGYKVHVPASYSPTKPTPVLYSFHGLQQNAVMFTVDGTGLIAESDADGFILVMPNGVQEDGIGGSWNAGVCCGAAAAAKLDDVGFVRAVHAELLEHLNIDPGRVYATGLSNGAFMTHRLGCEAADLFVAIAPLAGSIGTSALGATGTSRSPDLKECNPSRPVPVLAMHGSGDRIVPYSGMKPSLDHWAKTNGCGTTTKPASLPASGGDTTCVTYQDCPDGVEVTGCTVANGGHCWFGDASCGTGFAGIGNLFVGNDSSFLNASKAAWEFVSRFQR